jgi:PhzF family phenazine biosynthesis protein
MMRRFDQLDVFSAEALRGNPLAVVHDAQGLDDKRMAAFARWTNLSETTFLLPPTDAAADYRVRIFTPGGELPFAGHPTLGSCHAWLAAGGQPRQSAVVVQQCGVGLVKVRRDGSRLAFEAPALHREDVGDALLQPLLQALGLRGDQVRASASLTNGPRWVGLLLDDAVTVLGLKPDHARLAGLAKVGVIAAQCVGADSDFEVRAFAAEVGVNEDPVTGSLNASLAQWLIAAGLAPAAYVVAQGTALGRAGRVFVQSLGGSVWIGGQIAPCIAGQVAL